MRRPPAGHMMPAGEAKMDAIDIILPIATAIALSPLPIIAVVLIAGSPGARVSGPMYLAGWAAGLVTLSIAAAVVTHLVGDIGPTGAVVLDWLRAILGGLLLWAAARKWKTRPQGPEEPATPKWLDALRQVGPGAAMLWGATLAAVNPKHVGLVLAAMASLAYVPLSSGEMILSTLLLVALSSGPVAAVVVSRAIAGEAATPLLLSIEQFLLRNNDVIVMTVLGLIGMVVLGKGLSGILG